MYFCEKFSKRGVTSHQKIRSSRWEWCISASKWQKDLKQLENAEQSFCSGDEAAKLTTEQTGQWRPWYKRISMTWRTFTGSLPCKHWIFSPSCWKIMEAPNSALAAWRFPTTYGCRMDRVWKRVSWVNESLPTNTITSDYHKLLQQISYIQIHFKLSMWKSGFLQALELNPITPDPQIPILESICCTSWPKRTAMSEKKNRPSEVSKMVERNDTGINLNRQYH